MLKRRKQFSKYEQEILTYYKNYADQGSLIAQYCLGSIYEHGLGVIKKDHRLSIFWYNKYAEQNIERNISYLMHDFSYSLQINSDNKLINQSIDQLILSAANYSHVTIIIKYIGVINFDGNDIIISQQFNNPYNVIYNQVMATVNDNVASCSCIDSLCWMFTNKYLETQNLFDLINMKCRVFWQRKIQQLMQQADNIIDQKIYDTFDVAVSSNSLSLL